MEKDKTFGKFLEDFTFIIPDYQRAYSWEEKHLILFVKDIKEHIDKNNDPSDDTRYYLGHYILENTKGNELFEIVDGQQRICTVYLFLMVCGHLSGENYTQDIKFTPVSYDSDGLKQIQTVLNANCDVEDKFNEILEKSETTASLKRMVKAVILFKKAFSDSEKIKLEKSEIGKYFKVINNAYCSFAIFKDKSVASQIFELHNTRGVKLTETEKVKALLMKSIYINSSKPDAEIKEIQEAFSKIFKFEEKANEVWLRGEIPLDAILMYHLRAVDDGKKTSNFGSPQWVEGDRGSFEYVKEIISKMGKVEIVGYAKNLANEFAETMEIISDKIPNADRQNPLIGDVLLLDRTRSIIFLLRAFRASDQIDESLLARWENFILCYEIIEKGGYFYNHKSYRHNFDSIYQSIKTETKGLTECNNLLIDYYRNTKKFSNHWKHLGENTNIIFEESKNTWMTYLYGWQKTAYLLYKYEISNGADFKKIRENIFKGDSVSIDHIVARGLSWESLGYKYEENKQEADELWNDICLVINGIGNLALSTSSSNSSDSNGLPETHIASYKAAGLLKTVDDVESWKNPKEFADKIKVRSEGIIKFTFENIINRQEIWE
jgi:hypothetical protein